MGWHIIVNESGEAIKSKKVYYPVKDEAGEINYRRSGKLNFECYFKHDAVGMDQAWKITYALRKRKDNEGNYKYTHNFNIHAPDRKVPRRAHKLDDVMIVVKNAIFNGRNTTGSLNFNGFKRKLAEIVSKDFADNVANEFVSKIKEAVAG
jgi:hypothetical protein